MDNSAERHFKTEPTSDTGVPSRIVLVGRTGLDGVLATPDCTELVRVRNGMDALGEVSAWRRQHDGDLRGQVVVLGEAADADPSMPRTGRWVQALRRVDPQVRVLAVGRPLHAEGHVEGHGPEAFDGWLDIDDPAYSSRVLLHGAGRVQTSLPLHPIAPERPVEVIAPPRETLSRMEEPAPGDDGQLVRLVIEGHPVTDAALSLASQRLGTPLHLASAKDAQPGPGRAPLPNEEQVVLVGPRATGEALMHAAAWLASWRALEARHQSLRLQANTDPLTGAWNRRAFDDALRGGIEHARHARRDLSVLVFDIDDFKQYNDQHGHEAGDEILVEVVRLLNSVIRPSDKVCRIGGDEFAVIFDDPAGPREPTSRHPLSVVAVAQRFQAQVATKRFPKLGDNAPGRLTISGGLATFPWDGLDGQSLLRVADQRALECKHQGKNAIALGPRAD